MVWGPFVPYVLIVGVQEGWGSALVCIWIKLMNIFDGIGCNFLIKRMMIVIKMMMGMTVIKMMTVIKIMTMTLIKIVIKMMK